MSESEPFDVAAAVSVLDEGGLIAFPTDTVHALACVATNPDAVERFYALKQRPANQPSILFAHDIDSLRHWLKFDRRALRIAEQFWPGPLTLILPATERSTAELGAMISRGTLAARIPNHPVALALLRAGGAPLCTSSANRAGEPPPRTGAEVRATLGDEVDLIIDGECPGGIASSILDLSRPEPVVLREGAIPATRLLS